MDGETIRRLCDIPKEPESSLFDHVWKSCSRVAPEAAAFVFGTADGVLNNGTDRFEKQPSTMFTDTMGSIGIGLALKAAPKCISIPAAIAGGAGTMLFLNDAVRTVGDCVPIVERAPAAPDLARKQIANKLGPIAFESSLMLATGFLTGAATERIQQRPKMVSRFFKPEPSRMQSCGAESVHEYWIGSKPANDLSRVWAPGNSQRGHLALFRDLKVNRTAFGPGPLKLKTHLDPKTREAVRHADIGDFDPSIAERSSSSIRTFIPTLTRSFTGIACIARPVNHTEAKLYRRAQESVVQITADKRDGWLSSGTGFVVSEDGKIATALHVIEDARSLSVKTNDGSRYTARVIAHDFDTDLAVLKVDKVKQPFKPVTLLPEDKPTERDLYLFGHPAGSDTLFMSPGLFNRRTVEKHILVPEDSANKRRYTGKEYQATSYFAHCRSGYSGGPVLDSQGNVVAVHIAGSQHNLGEFREVRVGSGTSVSHLDKLIKSLPTGSASSELPIWRRSNLFDKPSTH